MKIVVTGMGIVSPLGNSVEAFWQALCAGRDGITDITRFDASAFPYQQAGEVRDLVLPASVADQAGGCDPATLLMLSAIDQAVAQAEIATCPPADTAVVLSTNFGGILSGETLVSWVTGDSDTGGDALTEFASQSCADHAASAWGWTGPRMVLSLSCSSGTAALAMGSLLIKSGRAARVVTGGYDILSRFCWSGLGALRTMTKDRLRPFDKNRDGTIFSEGAGAIVLESAAAAEERGATVLADLLGCATNNNAHHMTAPAPEGRGSADVMAAALADAGIDPCTVSHINTHGTGTKYNDITETRAIKTTFAAHAQAMPITSIKSMTGHLMGAAGSAEAIASILSIRDGIIPPTINVEEPDPECDLDCVTKTARKADVKIVLSNSAGITGCNASAILGAPGTGGEASDE